MTGSGDPYCSLVNVATAADGAPLLLISRLAVHTKNILADPRVSLMLDERKEGDPLQGARVMLMGTAAVTSDENARRRYLARQPEAEMFAGFGDFAFYEIKLKGAHLVAGFGRIVDLKPADLLTDITGAQSLLAAEPEVIDHMNRGSRRHVPALCHQAARRAGRRLALRRLRSGRARSAMRACWVAAAVPAARQRARARSAERSRTWRRKRARPDAVVSLKLSSQICCGPAAAVRAGGGTVDVINLPELGIKGNSHMLMQDKNNAQIAEVIHKWLVGKGLSN